ncbi:hypothetical protein [Achromobacter mucicolens]|uniref:hypothetical protein n=1 Tax=Achromobacter mucicolens TaxID=1389922 RepID=UPI0011B1E537|nr:hypothetical protein [Achromobacter mucicolens]
MTSRLNANAVPTRKRPSRCSFLSTAYAHVTAKLGDLNVAEAAKVFFSTEVRAIGGPRFFNGLKTQKKNWANFGPGEPKLARSSSLRRIAPAVTGRPSGADVQMMIDIGPV